MRKRSQSSKLRTANLLAALSTEVATTLEQRLRTHPNQTDSSAAALNVIGFFDGCSNLSLSKALRLSQTATVRLVDKLEAAGLVEGRPGADRRSVSLTLTPTGRERAKQLTADRCLALCELLDSLTEGQRDALDDALAAMLRTLVTTPAEAVHICRLCDEVACPQDRCPVHQQALAELSS